MTPVTYKKKLTEKESNFLSLKNRRGQCGAWSFDTFEEICFLHTAYSCCGQFDKRESDSNFISGYTCDQCWSTRNDCPCGKKNPLPYEPNLPNYPSQPTVGYQNAFLSNLKFIETISYPLVTFKKLSC